MILTTKRSIKVKLLALIAGLMIMALSAYAGVYYRIALANLLEQDTGEMKTFAVVIADQVGRHILTDREELKQTLAFVGKNSPALYSFTVFDTTCTVLASTFELDVGNRTRSEDHQQVLKDGKVTVETYTEKDGMPFLKTVVPVMVRDHGRIRTIAGGLEIVYLLEDYDQLADRLKIASALLLAAFIGLAVFASFFAARLFTKPLLLLMEGLAEVSRGNLEVRLPVGRKDEFGQVAESFNRMSFELSEANTELKAAAEEVQRLNAELELKVEERTGQLLEAQEELVRKEKLAILGQLSGSVGHELRNPLGVMNNAVYMLKCLLGDADETVREYLGMIEKEIGGSQRIITDLLDFARTKPPHSQAVAVRQLVEESLAHCAIPGNVALRTELAETLPALSVDPLQLRQVLQNLISNGMQAMPDGGHLSIKALVERQGAELWISIADQGVGIAPENMNKLFQPLFTTRARGVGLGLTICKNLTEANGGRIGVESRVGKGTTFTVMLPIGGKGMEQSATDEPKGVDGEIGCGKLQAPPEDPIPVAGG